MVPSEVVKYRVDKNTEVQIEIDPPRGYTPAAGAGFIVPDVEDAVSPAMAAAKVMLDRVVPLSADAVEIRFGVKVTGTETWSIARTAKEGNFEVTLSWRPTV